MRTILFFPLFEEGSRKIVGFVAGKNARRIAAANGSVAAFTPAEVVAARRADRGIAVRVHGMTRAFAALEQADKEVAV